MSNAERQRAYIARLKARAELAGTTDADLALEVVRLRDRLQAVVAIVKREARRIRAAVHPDRAASPTATAQAVNAVVDEMLRRIDRAGS